MEKKRKVPHVQVFRKDGCYSTKGKKNDIIGNNFSHLHHK